MLKRLLDNVSPQRLMDSVAGICTGERLNNEAEAASFAYMKAEYEKAGCETHMESHLGYVSTPEEAELWVDGKSYECVTHAMTPSVDDLTAPMVYVSHQEFQRFDPSLIQGRIVLTDGLALEPKVRALQNAGARGVVFITGKFIHTMIVSRVWGSPTPDALDKYVRIPVVSVSFADGQEIKGLAQKLPLARMSTRVWARWTQLGILVADIKGQTDDFILHTSHIDSWWLGAFDNASGNAAGLELARIFTPLANQMKRGIRFIHWTGHSQGRYAGSTAYCDAHFEELLEHCVLNVNADCMGGRGSCVLSYAPSMAGTHGLAAQALNEGAGVTDYEGHRFSRSGDMSFWGPGVPALYCQVSEQPPAAGAAAEAFSALFGGESKTGGFGYWWHTKEDTIDKLDPELLARDTRVHVATVYHAVFDDLLPVDAAAEARDLAEAIKGWAAKAGEDLDLSLAIARAEELAGRLAELDRRAGDGVVSAKDRNRVVSAVLRAIIPLGYVRGSIFRHDEAASSPAVPMLVAIDELARRGRDEHLRNCLLIDLRRDVNRLNLGLKTALALTEQER